MFEQIKRLLKSSGIYGLGVVSSKAVGFLMIPVYTRYLRPSDYGILELLDLIVFFAGIFAAIGIQSAVFRFFSTAKTRDERQGVVGTALLFYGLTSTVIAAIVFSCAHWVARLVFGRFDPTLTMYVRIVSATFLFTGFSEVPLAYLRAQEKVGKFVAIGLARTLIGAVSLGLALVVFKAGVLGVLIANLATAVTVGVSLYAWCLTEVPRRVDPRLLRQLVSYGAPLMAQSLASFVLVFSDRFFLRHYGTLADVGVYSLGYKIAAVVTLVVNIPFSMAWQWQQFELAKDENAKRMYSKIQTYHFFVCMCFTLAVSLLAKDVLRIATPPSYWMAWHFVPLIAFSNVLADVRSVVQSGIYIQRRTSQVAIIAVVTTITNIVLNWTLISRFRGMGAAWATMLSYLTGLAVAFILTQRVYHVAYEYARNAGLFACATVIYLAGRFIDLPVLPSIVTSLSLVGLYLVVAYYMLDGEEKRMFRNLGISTLQFVQRRNLGDTAVAAKVTQAGP